MFIVSYNIICAQTQRHTLSSFTLTCTRTGVADFVQLTGRKKALLWTEVLRPFFLFTSSHINQSHLNFTFKSIFTQPFSDFIQPFYNNTQFLVTNSKSSKSASPRLIIFENPLKIEVVVCFYLRQKQLTGEAYTQIMYAEVESRGPSCC